MGAVSDLIRDKLEAAFTPDVLEIEDDSARHAGHGGARPGGETHFNVVIVTPAFTGLSLVQRQRVIHAVLADELEGKVHALSIRALAPGEG
ncbi:MAG TPA: BolA family protein [Caulobacteraceae bacterium]|jgi:BolA protein|nr:BolA family protein [Caulobacteraceae bacterium]